MSKFLNSEQALDKSRRLEGMGEGLTPFDWSFRSFQDQLIRAIKMGGEAGKHLYFLDLNLYEIFIMRKINKKY